MQVLKISLFFFIATFLAGCSSSGTNNQPITGYNNSLYNQEDLSDSISLMNRDIVDDGNFRVGMLLPLSGEAAKYGQGLKNAALMALDDVKNDNLILQFYDTQSSSSGARVAAENAIDQNARLIIGPLMSNSVKAIKNETTYKNVPVLAFSTDENVLEPQVYSLGLLIDNQINRIITYAAEHNRSKFALLLPDNKTGIAIAKAAIVAAQKNNAKVTRIAFYKPDTTDFTESVKSLTDYKIRNGRLRRVKGLLANPAKNGSVNAQKALKRLDRIQALGDVDFDAVLISESGSRLKSAFAMFGYYDVYAPKVQFLGTSVWENTDLTKETMAKGAWYPALSRVHSEYFSNKYSEIFGEKPYSIFSLAYDAVALSSSLSDKKNNNLNYDLTAPEGYVGINGMFRLFYNGKNEHSLDIVEITENGDKVINPAPKKFSKNLPDNLINDEFFDSNDFQAPRIFGKNTNDAQIAIFGKVLDNQYQYQINNQNSSEEEMEIIRKTLRELNVVIP